MLAALEDVRPLFEGGPFSDAAFHGLWGRLRSRILDNQDEIQEFIASNEGQARTACLMVIVSMVREDLTSGRDHIYRGKLSLIGMGKKSINYVAMRELETAGVCSLDTRMLRAKELDEEIRDVG